MRKKRKKGQRFRGHTTHGFGAMKKHRGTGNKGGKGNAGSGKRGDAKKPSYWKDREYYGKFGFTPVARKVYESCNVQDLEQEYQKLLKQGKIKEQHGDVHIDLEEIGVQKLLSKGNPTKKWHITVQYASAATLEKMKEKGCTVVVKA